MEKFNNSNYNKVSVKTDSAVKLIETLKDLGVFKEKRKPRASKPKKSSLPDEEIRQEGDMGPGFTQPTQVRVEADTQGLTDEDVETKTNALIAQIRDEVAQNRIDDLQRTTQNLFTLFNAVQPKIQRGESTFSQPIEPFKQTATVYQLPDVEEERFTKSLNEGGPDIEPVKQETIFPTEEQQIEQQGQEIVKKQRLRTVRDKRKAFTDSYGLPELKLQKDFENTNKLREYFINFMDNTNNDYDKKILSNGSKMYKTMIEIIDSTIL